MQRTFLEFFAGGGMVRAGLGPGWRCLFANDIDPVKVAAYRDNWERTGETAMCAGDVAALTTAELPPLRADLAWASFPCQDLSLAGAGAGLAGDRSGTFVPFWRLMQTLRRLGRAPRIIVIENVCGLLTSHGGQDFSSLCRMLFLEDYRFGALVMDAADFLPHSRPRLFLIGIAANAIVPRSLLMCKPTPHWHSARLRAAHDALAGDLKAHWLWFAPAIPSAPRMALDTLIEAVPVNPPWDAPASTARLLGMMSVPNIEKIEAARRTGRPIIGTVYRRTRPDADGLRRQRAEVRFDGIAGCLRTPGGGSSRQTLLFIEGGVTRSRLLSARETARLMGLPDDYRLPVRYNDAYHLTGDGVAVPVVRWLTDQLLEPLLANSVPQLRIAA